jgi:hypothetical protein
MVSFRKVFLLLTALVAFAGIVSAQVSAPALCTAYRSNAPVVRSEGVAEEVGQVIIECSGGTPLVRGTPITNRINIQVFLDTQVTSRRTNSSGNVALESLLLIDNPTREQVNSATLCAIDIVCPATAVGDGFYNDPSGTIVNYNVFQGKGVSTNSIIWQGIPFDAPGTTQKRFLRIVNVRANANALPLSTLLPTAVRMYITISGTGAPNLTVNQLEVAYVQEGLQFGAAPEDSLSFLQCESSSGDYNTPGVKAFRLRFREKFPTAFRDNVIQDPPGDQADLTQIYNTESMYYEKDVAGAWPGTGLATQPTRLMAKISGLPAGVRVRVPLTASSSAGDVIKYTQCFDTPTPLGQNCSMALLTGSTVTIDPIGGVVTLVYEMTASNPSLVGTLDVRTELLWSAGIEAANISITGNYAPISTTTSAVSGPVPRFVDSAKGPVAVTINPCRTNLLFPYVTNQGGFDTGLVISNTSADKFGTVAQKGTCTLDYFGNIDGAAIPEADASQTTEVIEAGTQAIGLVSSGIKGTKGLPKFGGYVIAKCNFQYAHGYAFLYTGGASFAGAQGYLALVLDGDKDAVTAGKWNSDGTLTLNRPVTRTKSVSEVRAH